MEITTSPHRPASTPWGRLLVLVVIIAPVSVLVLLPIGLGLDRYVMSGGSMDSGAGGGIPQGSIVLERAVPVGDLRRGDVITFRPPASAGVDGLVTHRIVHIGPEGIITRGDAEPARDPWVLQPSGPTLPRVVHTLPWVGYVYLVVCHPITRTVLAGAIALLALLIAGEIRRRREAAAARRADPGTASAPPPVTASRETRGGEG